jgi:hypothetical protein
MRRELALLVSGVLVASAWGCGLNPQPLPPDSDNDAGLTIATPTVGDASRMLGGGDAGKGGSFPDDDAGGVGAGPDATTAPPPGGDAGHGSDGGENEPPDASGLHDAATDAPHDGGVQDGDAHDATPVDGGVDSASAPDAGVDAAL